MIIPFYVFFTEFENFLNELPEEKNGWLKYKKRPGQLRKKEYFCYRSGKSNLKPQPARTAKSSVKIGATCPFYLNVNETASNVEVEFYNLHLGHSSDNFGHERVPKAIKEQVKERLKLNIPAQKIKTDLNRVLRKEGKTPALRTIDVHNIKKSLNPKAAVK